MVVSEFIDDLEEALQRLGIAIRQVGVFEDVAEGIYPGLNEATWALAAGFVSKVIPLCTGLSEIYLVVWPRAGSRNRSRPQNQWRRDLRDYVVD